METFKEIYNNIINEYSKEGKTDEEIEKIMTFEFGKNKYDLIYEKDKGENKIRNYLKSCIKFLLTFYMNN